MKTKDELPDCPVATTVSLIGMQRIQNRETRAAITRIEVPATVTFIGDAAFAKCANLKEIILPDSIETFGANVFLKCAALEELILPKKTRGKLRYYFFRNCKNLKRLTIPKGVTAITEWSFSGCDSLEEFHLPKSVKNLDFSSLDELKNVTVFASTGSFAQQYAEEHGLRFHAE